jgi:hypothetical protein
MNTASLAPGERSAFPVPPLRTEYVFTAHVRVGPALIVGPGPLGLRRYVPIIGGTVHGPLLNGTVVPGGGDSQFVRTDGVLELEARYSIRTDEGLLAMVINSGLRFGTAEVIERLARGEPVQPAEYYFRTTARIEAPSGSRCDWLNRAILVGTAERTADAAIVHFYRVL